MEKTKKIAHDGLELTLTEWAKRLEISRQALWNRLSRMPLADALRDPDGRTVVTKKKRCSFIDVDGRYMTPPQAAKHFGVSPTTIHRWISEKRLTVHRERPPQRCSNCHNTGHRFSTCPDLYLKRGKKRAPAAPPRGKELRAAGIPPKVLPDEELL